MTRIVINACFGGFSLSQKACERYAEIKGFKLYRYFDGSAPRIYGNDYRESAAFCHYTLEPIPGLDGDVLPERCDGPEYDFFNKHYWSYRDIARDDPALVQTVKELSGAANGTYAKLRVVSIPDDVEWEIEEYDGNEHVAEQHMTWS